MPRALPSAQALFDEEFVPLAIAAGIAYGHIVAGAAHPRFQPHVHDVELVAIALSTVAPLWQETAAGTGVVRLDAARIEATLFRPLREGAGRPLLDKLCIRRSDLRRAMITLREARVAYGGRG